ncbi:hypothetical protein RBA16_21380, partial [Mycobacteroides abscessus subsp. massiliense]|uniref:hypothetical protein n=1 Tax=Mycobacteroides abscessus TaxID=36809 RepID=UPI003CF2379F
LVQLVETDAQVLGGFLAVVRTLVHAFLHNRSFMSASKSIVYSSEMSENRREIGRTIEKPAAL